MKTSEIAYVIRERIDRQFLATEGSYGSLTAAHFYSKLEDAMSDRREDEEVLKVRLTVETLSVVSEGEPQSPGAA